MKFFRAIKDIFKRKKTISTIDALAKLMSVKELELIVRKTPDRRYLTREVAHKFGQSEQYILGRLASIMGVGFVAQISEFPQSYDGDLNLLQKAGACPLFHDQMLVGIVCVDPEYYLSFFPDHKDQTFYLASWELILQSLVHQNEKLKKVENSPTCIEASSHQINSTSDTDFSLDLVIKVMRFMKSEASKHGSCLLTLNLKSENIEYAFETRTGALARGKVKKKMWSALERVLIGDLDLLLDVWNSSEGLKVTRLSPSSFRLNWQLPKLQVVKTVSEKLDTAPYGEESKNPKDDQLSSDCSDLPEGIPESQEVYSVLLVEDNNTFARVLERFFSRHNMITDLAENGLRALEILEEGKVSPDLIVCDVHMPQMNGMEFIKRLKSQEVYKEIPLIILTSDEDVETELELLKHGADAFLSKSQDPRLLGVQARNLVEKFNRFKKVRRAA